MSSLLDILTHKNKSTGEYSISPGRVVMKYRGVEHFGDLLADGVIQYDNKIFKSLSAFSSYCIEQKQAKLDERSRAKSTVDGWIRVYYIHCNGKLELFDAIRKRLNISKRPSSGRSIEAVRKVREKEKEKARIRNDIFRILYDDKVKLSEYKFLVNYRRNELEEKIRTFNLNIEHALNKGYTDIPSMEPRVIQETSEIEYNGVAITKEYIECSDRTRKSLRKILEKALALRTEYLYQLDLFKRRKKQIKRTQKAFIQSARQKLSPQKVNYKF